MSTSATSLSPSLGYALQFDAGSGYFPIREACWIAQYNNTNYDTSQKSPESFWSKIPKSEMGWDQETT